MMTDEPQKVEVVKAEVVAVTPDEIEVDLDVRISRLEADEAESEQTTKQLMLSVVGLQEASLKHSVILALFLAVCFFVASRALGA